MEEAGKQLVSAPLTEAITASRLLARLGGDAKAMFERIRDESAIVTLALFDAGEQPCQIIAGGAVADIVLALDGERVIAFERGRQEAFLENLADLPIAHWELEGGTILSEGSEARAEFLAAVEEWKLLTAAELHGMARRPVGKIGRTHVRNHVTN